MKVSRRQFVAAGGCLVGAVLAGSLIRKTNMDIIQNIEKMIQDIFLASQGRPFQEVTWVALDGGGNAG